ncbi:hypothetical protein BELL_0803g00020 [Botrytis elliptica]|uniref:Uncharacterized protein n=1 Tax=Botrytis elliptica TaxID=278938 RepID=A0A4Z1JBQ7_9HELO|nr:hypothetical protein BELL_0803g00020 [Botrytis elliptica]
MTDLIIEVAKANAPALVNMATEFAKLLNDSSEVKILMALAMLSVIPYIIFGCPTQFSAVLLAIGFIYVESNFEGPQKYRLIFVLVCLALLIYNLQNRQIAIEQQPN